MLLFSLVSREFVIVCGIFFMIVTCQIILMSGSSQYETLRIIFFHSSYNSLGGFFFSMITDFNCIWKFLLLC